jgi:ubiquinone/menaquinone biosynthesis C-methylase UbiE
MEKRGTAGHRRELLARLSGRVVEVGAGNGLNFAHYPPEVTEVVAVEPEPYLRQKASDAAAEATPPIRLAEGLADRLPGSDAEFDAAVASLVLCSVPDQSRALAEIRRVLRPGGELRFYEHVRGEGTRARLQDVANLAWPHLGAGCHPNRDTVGAIEAAGFRLERVRRFDFLGGPTAPHVIGVAVRP